MPTGLPGSGWSYYIRGKGTYCRSCNRKNINKPPSQCESTEHFNYYTKVKAQMSMATMKLYHRCREQIFNHYGRGCVCCGSSSDSDVLTIDRVAGNHEKYGEYKHSGVGYYSYLTKNNFPGGYRVLCQLCNKFMLPGESICRYHEKVK